MAGLLVGLLVPVLLPGLSLLDVGLGSRAYLADPLALEVVAPRRPRPGATGPTG